MEIQYSQCQVCNHEIDGNACYRCNHTFHKNCQSDDRAICPVCNDKILPATAQYIYYSYCYNCGVPAENEIQCENCHYPVHAKNYEQYQAFMNDIRNKAFNNMFIGIAIILGGIGFLLLRVLRFS